MSKQTLSKIFRLVSKIATIVSMILFSLTIFLAPVVIIFGIITLKYIAGLEKGEKPNLTKSILSLFANPSIALLLVVDYFLMKDEEVQEGNAVQGPKTKTGIVEKYKAEQMAASKIFEKEFGVKEENNETVKAPKKKSSTPRLIAYASIIGGLTLGAVALFTFSQFEKAKYVAAKQVISSAGSLIETAARSDSSIVIIGVNDKTDEKTYKLNTEVSDEKKETDLYKHAAYLVEVYDHFQVVKVVNNVFYVVSALPSYLLSMGALVSVGLILNHSEKVKEKEEKEV